MNIRRRRQRRTDKTTRPFHLESLEKRQLLAADLLQITIENLAPSDGLAQTPFWVAAHDGNFDLGDEGAPAADFGGLEELAEGGDVSVLAARFASDGIGNDDVIAAPGGFAGAPVFEPGEVVTQVFDVDDTQISRYFSFASMVIPSNDAFVANLDPMAHEIYDAGGDFLGPQSIVIYGNQIWDSGTEVNDPNGGAAFTTAGGTSADEAGVIHPHQGLDDFIGVGLPTGGMLDSAFVAQTPIARITISQASAPSGPIDGSPPKSSFDAEDLTTRSDTFQVAVTYFDASGVDTTSIDIHDIKIFGPALLELDVIGVTVDAVAGTAPRTVTATYEIAPPDSGFNHIHNGLYEVQIQAGEVRDVFAASAPGSSLGHFQVDIATRLQVQVESLGDIGGLGQTPFWVAAHNGGFEIGRAGVSADSFGGLEEIAEGGDVGPLAARFSTESTGNDVVITAPDGFPGAPVFEPGEEAVAFLDVRDPQLNRYFSFASMIIPSNDALIANLDPRAHNIFDRFGNFTGPQTITVYGRHIWDAGTELNDPAGGAAFTTAGGASVDENGVIHQHLGLDDFLGVGLPTGENLDGAFQAITPIARITLSLADNPSAPMDSRGPMAELAATDLTMGRTVFHEVEVAYADPSGVNVDSIDVNDIEIVSNFANPLRVVSVSTDATDGTIPQNVTATYRLAPLDGGPFSTFDNAIYNVVLKAGQVSDTLGNHADAQRLGDFSVQVGVQLQVTVENLAGPNGLGQTPFWVAFHEGEFETARLGASAAEFPGLEEIAEGGDVSALAAAFATASSGIDGLITAPDGFPGAPVFEPGEMASGVFEVLNTHQNRYFSFASMIIPSNDAFLANLNAQEHELFDERGVFVGPQSITLFGNDIWDAGTEVNDPSGGAAFTKAGGTSVDQDGVITAHRGLQDFLGVELPTGNNLERAFFARTPVARITISLADNPVSPFDMAGPVAFAESNGFIDQVGTASHEVEVTYNDPSGLDLTSFGLDDLQVVGPLGQTLIVNGFEVDAPMATTPNSVTVTYTVTTEDGQFTARDNGRYEVSIRQGAVNDTLSQDNEFQTVGELRVDVGIRIQVEIETLTPTGGLAQTPFFIGVHEGNFEIGRAGTAAADFGGLELIAEEGDPSELAARFAAESHGVSTVITSPAGFPGAPVFEPGEVATQIIEVNDTNVHRYLSFASMIIPSNDAFIANLDPRRIELFDNQGNFQGARALTIYGRDVYDAGTEVNDPAGGAAFSTGGGSGVDENGVIRKHPGLGDFVGTGLPTGEDLESAFSRDTPLVRLTITLVDPEATTCSGVLGACSVQSVSLHNPQLAFDVNADGFVSALDALLVVDFLNQFGSTSTIADEARAVGYMLDVSGDSSLSALDALLVINRLNSLSGGEGEASSSHPDRARWTDAAFAAHGFPAFDIFDPFDDDEEDENLAQALIG